MEKYICIHGHFYQPPRENPWLEFVELQDSASPYHDWNERITAECYAPNTTARILNGEGKIEAILNNYSKISFNFGPTLLAWMKDKNPDIHEAIVLADRRSREHFSGHGNAIAQAYNHMILPLGNEADKYTQIFWGIRDFEFRFGHPPEGLWLAETAVNTPTLEVMAQLGIKFTILSPHQAHKVREIGNRSWRDVNGGRIDPTRAYLCKLPSGKSIHFFFYDGPVSQAIAFEKLLTSGERFAGRLMGALSDKRGWNQMVHVATDGESYGHHHKHGEMALAYALKHIESSGYAQLTNYGEFLEKNPPTYEVQIHENSAWSCCHGVGRWMRDCGCNSGGNEGWNQAWRAPLREALDWLRDTLQPLFERKVKQFLNDPWQARNDYIHVILDRSPKRVQFFFDTHAHRELTSDEQVVVLKLMEIQRHAMLMYTSCGWFFDELSGIETVQVIQYAGRAIQLARQVLNTELEAEFLDRLHLAKSNIPEHQDGRHIYLRFVKPAMIDWEQVTAHYAVSSVFHDYAQKTQVFLYEAEDLKRHTFTAGRVKLVVGRTRVLFQITRENVVLSYAALYLGEHNLTCGVRDLKEEESFNAMLADLKESFDHADFPETIRRLDRHFGTSSYSLKSLFKDEQRKVLDQILLSTREDLEKRYRLITERYTPLMRFLKDINAPLPPALDTAADFILYIDLCRAFEAEEIHIDRLEALLAEARERNLDLSDPDLTFAITSQLDQTMTRLALVPGDLKLLKNTEALASIAKTLPLRWNLWRVQNFYWQMMQDFPYRAKPQPSTEEEEWHRLFLNLGDHLGFAVNHLR